MKCLTKDDITSMWLDNEWPEGFSERRKPETAGVTTIDLVMFYRFMMMNRVQKKNEKESGIPVTVAPEDQPIEFRPYPELISDTPGVPVLTAEEIAKVPGGE